METAEHEAAYGPYEKTANVEYRQVSWDLNGGEWTADDNHATQTTKDGKLYAPIPPTKTDNIFGGWYTDPSLRYKADFPYDVRSVTEDFTLYAKWYVASEPSSKLSYLVVSAEVLGYNYISVQRETDDGSFENAYSIPTEPGTGEIDVLQGVYRIEYSFWTCLTDDCTVTLYSYTFYVPAGETREIQIIGSSVIR
jgi:uncharacterized repeat protein (TIGR02543 family)